MRGKGPIFLYINLALALAFGFWGLGLYRSRVDFPAIAKEKDGEISRLKNAAKSAEDRWRNSLQPLVMAEKQRPELQKWYADHLKNLREGNQPILALKRTKSGDLEVDGSDKIALEPVTGADRQPIQGLRSIKLLNSDYTQVTAAIKQVVDQIQAKLKDEQQLNDEIGDGTKGLRAKLAATQLEERNSLDEQEDLKPLLYNRQVEAQLLAKRNQALKTRIQELQSVRVAQQP
jgi:hypothetical protein